MSVNWKIIFRGGLLPGFNIQDVKPVVQQWMRLSEEQLNRLFCGREIILKKGITYDEGTAFVRKMALLGLQVYLIEDEEYLSLHDEDSETDTNDAQSQKNHSDTGYGSKNLPAKNTTKKYVSILGQHTNTARDNMHYIPDEHREKAPSPLEFSFTGRFGRLNFLNASILIFCLFLGTAFFFLVVSATFGLELSSLNSKMLNSLSIAQLMLVIMMLTATAIFFLLTARIAILRLHDLNLSGFWFSPVVLVCLSTGASLFQAPSSTTTVSLLTSSVILLNIVFLFLSVCPGTKRINKFGSPANQGNFSGLIAGFALLITHSVISFTNPDYLSKLQDIFPSSSEKTTDTKDAPAKKGATIEFE